MTIQDHNNGINQQGSCLDEATRLEYLQAMGIQAWSLKHPAEIPLQTEAEVIVSAPSSAESLPAVETVMEQPVKSGRDISSLGWDELKQVVSECQLCELHTTRTRTVFGVGNQNADLMIIGEAPGEEEDRQGEPFVGRAGQLLDAMLQAIGLDRQTVYIANVLKCRPPGNRNPHTSETVCCDAYLQQQIKLVQPKLILAMGRIAAHHLLVSQDSLAALRQKKHYYNGIPLRVSYHPAYLLRQPVEKRKSWLDLLEVKQFLAKH